MILIQLEAGHHRPASETPFKMAFRWRADDGLTLNAGLVAFLISQGYRPVLLRNPLAFFRWGRVRTPCPLLWTRARRLLYKLVLILQVLIKESAFQCMHKILDVHCKNKYSKTCVKRPLKNRQNKDLIDRRSKVLQIAPFL